jgi:hypothetical protein
MPQSHRDHGVAAHRHWLLDEELRTSSRGRAARPAVLEPVEIIPLPATPVAAVSDPPRRNFVLFAAGLVTALLVYALLSSAAVVGALEEALAGEQEGSIHVIATFEPPSAREVAELRSLLARPAPTAERPIARESSIETQKPKSPQTPNAPGPDDGVLPPLPPPPAPPPISEIPEVPALEIPPLPALEARASTPAGTARASLSTKRATGLEPATLSLEG